jgi:hypothetical protein
MKLYDYSNEEWAKLSRDAKKKIQAERKKDKKGTGSPSVRTLAKKIKQQEKKIAALTGANKRPSPPDDDAASATSASTADAGNSFGGRQGKINQKASGSKKPKAN